MPGGNEAIDDASNAFLATIGLVVSNDVCYVRRRVVVQSAIADAVSLYPGMSYLHHWSLGAGRDGISRWFPLDGVERGVKAGSIAPPDGAKTIVSTPPDGAMGVPSTP